MDKDNDGRLSAADLHRAFEQVRRHQACFGPNTQRPRASLAAHSCCFRSRACPGYPVLGPFAHTRTYTCLRRTLCFMCRLPCPLPRLPKLTTQLATQQVGVCIKEEELTELFLVADITGQVR